MGVGIWALVFAVFFGAGVRTLMKSNGYAAKISQNKNTRLWLTGIFVFLGLCELAVALFMGYVFIRPLLF